MSHHGQTALEVLKETSRTFFIPISRLPSGLLEAVASGYLCMRAIDEIEDHPDVDNTTKALVLREISQVLQSGVTGFTNQDFDRAFGQYADQFPEVSRRLGEWASYAPSEIAPRVWEATAAMADRMAYWAERNWDVQTEYDLDRYTFSVAGSVGLLLSDLWSWHDGTQTDRIQAIGFGRGLQAVNILRNHREDLDRGVSFFPDGWTVKDLDDYARRNLQLADRYTESLPKGPARDFCELPLALAHATLDAMTHGFPKLTRSQVMAVVAQFTGLRG
ncbi:squalene/phytoene synthase family protein [Alkalinema pantanalense CENA528]|uniref:squalene/phytoene synthase family protein n=1 Tax=Alkalinema pantanalense TaxID=1620705 RepID=UPI003D6EAC94